MIRYQGGVRHSLRTLAADGFVREIKPNHWALTEAGIHEAQSLTADRSQKP
jgi:hypothetical protein